MVQEHGGSWYETLARKAMGAGALIRDELGRVLLVEPTYKPTWEIPGGMVEAGESAAAACARELYEELGLRLPVGRLLCLDWASTVPGRGDGVRFIYDGGRLPAATVLRLPEEELASARFVDLEEAETLCAAGLAVRIRAAVRAATQGKVVEIQDGQSRSPTSQRVQAITGELSFGYDGDRGLGDRLLAAVLRGEKTATSCTAVEYLSGEPLPQVGQRLTLMDHHGREHGVVETTRVRIIPLHLVGDDVARAEGEGFADAEEWRREHVSFWHEVADLVRADAGDPDWQLRESEPVVVHWFRLLEPSAADQRR